MGTLHIDCLGRALIFLTLTFTLNLTSLQCFRHADDTLMQGENLELGTLTSASQFYSLRFTTMEGDDSGRVYLAITSSIVGCLWLANQNTPLFWRKAKLVIDDYGSLKVMYSNDTEAIVLYSSEASRKINASATLLNTGNLVLRQMNTDGTIKQVLWQSYDHPNYVMVPGMRVGFNKITGKNWTLTSWTGENTPAPGSFTLGVDPNSKEQLAIWWKGSLFWTSGPFSGGIFSNLNATSGRYDIHFTYVSNENETYFSFDPISMTSAWSNIDYFGLNPLGQLYQNSKVFVSCSNARVRGCVAQSLPTCRNQGAYLTITRPKYGNISPQQGYTEKEYDKLSLHDCAVKCLNNCSCYYYSPTSSDNSGCQIWGVGTKFASAVYGRPIYVIPRNTTNNGQKSKAYMKKLWIASVISGALLVLISSFVFYVLWRKHIIEEKQKWKQKKMLYEIEGIATPFQSPVYSKQKRNNKIQTTKYGMHMFSFESIELATDNFSSANKLGKGGFGPVYKGQLLDGREIAIKRLSTNSRQGLTEFKNEVKLIAKLQHTNLVKLHGFCIERDERMLIYEYMPNKSLDFYLFDSKNKILLDWKRRFGIIQGITQGLVYLHTYSRLTVIHRDLKPSNILLDSDMNPKISDFGLARIFGLEESDQNTNRVVGTYGYMSPEYVFNGIVSPKVDVFSFGVMVLEIVSGKKNSSIYASDFPHSFIGHAWQMWNMDKALGLIDPIILNGSCDLNEVLRCIHISLLCVQDQAEDRPTMSDVVFFLSSEAIQLTRPKQPALFPNKKNGLICPIIDQNNHSINNVTITSMRGR